MKNSFLGNLLIILVLFLFIALEQIFLPAMNIFFLGQWLIFTLIFILNFFKPEAFSLELSLLSGLLIDFVSGGTIGAFSITFFFLAVIIQGIGGRLEKNTVSFIISLIFSITFFYFAGCYLPKIINLI
ncbi:MAG: rod shape-determining protein MreD [Candidatus Pacebacteria bacterium]|nr:rod shape-determining protein MreD [Candidatus Paceibacterota bacterium]